MTIRISRNGQVGRTSILGATLDFLTAEARRGLADVIFQSVQQHITEPARQDVPVDSGALRSTIGIREIDEQSRDRVSVSFGYGGIAPGTWESTKQYRVRINPDTNTYARYVHDNHATQSGFFEINYQMGKELVRRDVVEYLRSAARKSRKR